MFRYSQSNAQFFSDDLGLLQTANLQTSDRRIKFEYKVLESTNIQTRTFPLKFAMTQFRIGRNGEWQPHLEASGIVTSIRESAAPMVPADLLNQQFFEDTKMGILDLGNGVSTPKR